MIAVIGDIHGCFHTLEELVNKIKTKYNGIPLYSVGDLVDRGKFSLKAVDFILENDIKFTPGNHDYMFYYFIKDSNNEIGRSWLYNGYESTINSYHDNYEKMMAHLSAIGKAPLFINLPDCFISHAGVSNILKSKLPSIDEGLDEFEKILNEEKNSEHGILWTRDDLLNLGKLQIVGHTRHQEINYNEKNNSVYIDTSVYTGNKLSAIIVDEGKIIDSLSVPTKEIDIK